MGVPHEDKQTLGDSARSAASAVAGLAGAGWRRLHSAVEAASGATDPAPQHQMEEMRERTARLEARVSHLEAAHEGLQDALYRRALLEDKNFEDLRRRIEPEQIARDLSEDARRRGL